MQQKQSQPPACRAAHALANPHPPHPTGALAHLRIIYSPHLPAIRWQSFQKSVVRPAIRSGKLWSALDVCGVRRKCINHWKFQRLNFNAIINSTFTSRNGCSKKKVMRKIAEIQFSSASSCARLHIFCQIPHFD